MTIKAIELLKLMSKANQLDLIVAVDEKNNGDYGIYIHEEYSFTESFGEEVVITQKGESDWNKGDICFDAMMDLLDEKLEERRQEKIMYQKREELLARLTDEEKELLGVK
jgi:hypothetical protein